MEKQTIGVLELLIIVIIGCLLANAGMHAVRGYKRERSLNKFKDVQNRNLDLATT